MAFGGLVKDSVALYALQKIARGTGRRGRIVLPEEDRALSKEINAWWLRALGLTMLGRALRAVWRVTIRRGRQDLIRFAERRLAKMDAEQEPPPPPAEALV
jgi:hypothetical protein